MSALSSEKMSERRAERVAIVGSSDGSDLEAVEGFVRALWDKYPDTILVSGGDRTTPRAVDARAEDTWLALGGEVISFRVRAIGHDTYGIERWELGGPQPRVFLLVNEPTWADYKSALLYRNLLIAEECDRLVLFHKPRWRGGGGMTADSARIAYDKPTYEYERS